MRQYALVRLSRILPDIVPEYAEALRKHRLRVEQPLIYLGEIPNMLGHGVFVGNSGRVHFGYHIEGFEEIPDDET